MDRRKTRKGFTLTELVAVVSVIAIVAVIAFSRAGSLVRRAKITAAEADMAAIRSALLDSEAGLVRDLAGIPGFQPSELRLANLIVATNLYGMSAKTAALYPTGEQVDAPGMAPGRGIATNRLEFTTWDEERQRGWHGPYINSARGEFPRRGARRFDGDATAEERGFYPDVSRLYLAQAFTHPTSHDDASIYGFPGEAAIIDPWGNPYVLQVPSPQAFTNDNVRSVSPDLRWLYARIVSAGEDGVLETPCHFVNHTNSSASAWSPRQMRIVRQAGLVDSHDLSLRGDDLVLFLNRGDIDEGGTP